MNTTIKNTLKAIPALGLLGIALAGKAQSQPFTIEGAVAHPYAHAVIYIKNISHNKLDSASITNGHFTYSDTASDFPLEVSVGLKHSDDQNWFFDKDYVHLYVDPGKMNMTMDDSASKASYTGATNDEVKKYVQAIHVQDGDKYNVNGLWIVFFSFSSIDNKPLGPDTSASGRALQARNVYVAQRQALQRQYIVAHPDNFASVLAMIELVGTQGDTSKGQIELFNTLSDRVKETYSGKKIAGVIAKKKAGLIKSPGEQIMADMEARKAKMRPGFNIGATAADFTLNDANDKPVKLSDFKGKYVLLDFWASWCGPCRQENPNVVKAYNEYKDKNFTVLGVALEQPGQRDQWLAAIKKDGLPWTEVSDFNYFNSPVTTMYNVKLIPRNYLIDPSGKVIAIDLRGDALQNKLAELLAN